MSQALDIVRNDILAAGDLSERDLESTLGRLLEHSVDEADLYFQSTRSEGWVLEDGIVKQGSHNIEQGVGVRAVSGEKSGFAYSDELASRALAHAASAARSIARAGGDGRIEAWRSASVPSLYAASDPIESFAESARIALLERADAEARRLSPDVRQVIVGVAGEYSRVLVASSDGTFAGDVRPLVRMNVSVIVERDGRREQASAGGGGRFDYRYFTEGGPRVRLCARGGAPGARQPGGGVRAGRHHDRGARSGLARSAAARGDRARARRRLQPQGQLGVRRPHRRAGRERAVHGGRRRDARATTRIAHRRRRGHADPVHHPHRERHPEGLHAGQDERAPHRDEADRKRAARILRPPPDAPHDQHLHAARGATSTTRSSRRWTRGSTR